MTLSDVAFVIPCFNEERRLLRAEFLRLLDADPTIQLVFVDDGSRDDTLKVLRDIQSERASRIEIVTQAVNGGKAEAVRQGLLYSLGQGAQIVAYLDADLSTPVDEALRLLSRVRDCQCDVLLASRVALLGREIVRTAPRHYAGRVFASAASAILRLRVYDTQCGAKFFRATPALEGALRQPFLSRWAFDVELLARLTTGPDALRPERIVEEPLLVWRDVADSKLGFAQMANAGLDLAKIAWSLRRLQR